MTYYQQHLFFCTNQKADGKPCCQDKNAEQMFQMAKQLIQELGLFGPGQIRVSKAGCLGRCAIGPCVVVYPAGIWYTYQNENDVAEIINSVATGQIVERLLLDEKAQLK